MGIIAGLSMSAVNRLKNTFKGLDSKQAEVLGEKKKREGKRRRGRRLGLTNKEIWKI